MNVRVVNIWDRFQGSFWFVPALFLVASAALGIWLPVLEADSTARYGQVIWLATTPDGARAALSGIAGAMITVAGVVFSVTMVTLSIAASQFGSRVLRSRMRDRATQIALGTFLGTSVYCFLVLTTIRGTDDSQFVPHLSVSLGIAAAVASLFVLVYFIHNVSEAVQAPYVIARLAADLDDSIDRLFPEKLQDSDSDETGDEDEFQGRFNAEAAQAIEGDCEGYLQAVDAEALAEAARQSDAFIRLIVRPGDFLMARAPIAKVSGEGLDLDELTSATNAALIVGAMRTPRQDVNCTIHELAQLTVRALSPGINDPFTAVNGIDRLAAALGRIAQRRSLSCIHKDADGQARVFVQRVTFAESLSAAFNQIRQNARSAPPVGVRLLEALERIAQMTRGDTDRETVKHHAAMVLRAFDTADHLDEDRQAIREQFQRVKHYFDKGEPHQQGGQANSSHGPDAAGHSLGDPGDESSGDVPAQGEVNG